MEAGDLMTKPTLFQRMTLLTLPKYAPEICLFAGHNWAPWGEWYPLQTTFNPRPWTPEDGPVETKAHRARACLQCLAVQGELYSGEVTMLDDPHEIEARRVEAGL